MHVGVAGYALATSDQYGFVEMDNDRLNAGETKSFGFGIFTTPLGTKSFTLI